MKKCVFLIMGMLCVFSTLGAQSPPEIKPLSIGDTVPDMLFQQVMNYPADTARLSDFTKNKKLLILDFWSTSCSACIEFFPHLQALSDSHQDDFQVLLVNSKTGLWHDNEAKIKRVIANVEKNSNVKISLPIVLNCKILDKYFPNQTIPHEVWIDNAREVIGITNAAEVNSGNIASILAGKKISMPVKDDIVFDLQKHSLSELVYGENSNRLKGKAISSFILYKGPINGLRGGMGIRSQNNDSLYKGWYVTNQPLLSIYKHAYQLSYPNNRILITTKDSGRFRKADYSNANNYSNLYSCDIITPPETFKQLLKAVRQGLENTLHVKVTEEKREVTCLVLHSSPRLNDIISKGGKKKYVMGISDDPKYVRNFPIPELIRELNLKYFNTPVIDETGIKTGVDLDMPNTLTQENILGVLKNAGFTIVTENRILNVAIISDYEDN